MSRLFKRVCALTVARPLTEAQLSVVDLPPNGTLIENLRVAFRCEKSLASEPNTAEITVYNLAEQPRGEIQRTPLYVRLDAGYDDQAERLFVGDLRPGSGRSVRRGVDWETTLEVGDAERAYKLARVSRSYRGGVDARTALAELAKAMGLSLTYTADTERVLRSQYASGLSMHGPASRELSRVLAPHGLTWSVQDGRLQVIRSAETRPDAAQVVSQDSGLVGVPEFAAPENRGDVPVLHVKMLLRPGLTPGGRIKLVSNAISGVFRVERVVHTGDTHGEAWHTEVEARAGGTARAAALEWIRPRL